MNRNYRTLELDKILERLAAMTTLEDAKQAALNLEPQFDLKRVELLLKQTDDAVALSGRFGLTSSALSCCSNRPTTPLLSAAGSARLLSAEP